MPTWFRAGSLCSTSSPPWRTGEGPTTSPSLMMMVDVPVTGQHTDISQIRTPTPIPEILGGYEKAPATLGLFFCLEKRHRKCIMATEPNETKHTNSHMKKLILIFAAAFGFAYGVSAQDTSDTRNMLDIGTSAEISAWELRCEITDAVESGTCAVIVRYQSDYFPVRFIQDGKVLKTTNSPSDSVKVEGVKYEMLPRGGMKYIIEVRNPRGATFLVNRKAPKDSEDEEMTLYNKEEVLDIVDNLRTPTPAVDSVEVLPEEPKLPDPEFYLVSIEVDANKIPEHPAWVVSYTPDGRSFTRSVNIPGGVGINQDNYKMMVGILARMTPYSVEPGERLYKGALIMRNGKKIKIRVRQPIDQP